VYVYAKRIVDVSQTLSRLGADKALLRYLPEQVDDSDAQNETFGLAFVISVSSATIIAVTIFLFTPEINALTLEEPALTPVLRLFAVSLPIVAATSRFVDVLRAVELIRQALLIRQFLRPSIWLVSVLAAILLGYSVIGVTGAVLAATVVVLAVTVILYQSVVNIRFTLTRSRETIFEYLYFSVPLVFSEIGYLLYKRVDVLMVGYFLTSADVGIYNIAVIVTTILQLPLDAVNQLFPPIASRLYAEEAIDELSRVYETVVRWIFAATVLLAALQITFRSEILALFGSEFARGSTVLVLFVLAQLFNAAAGPSNFMLMMTDNQYYSSVNDFLLGTGNIVLNYIFILEFGLIGAAVASASVLGIVNVIRVIEVWYLEGFFPYSSAFMKPLAVSAAATSVMLLIGMFLDGLVLLLIGSGIGTAVYVGLAYLIVLDDRDKRVARDFIY